ncbi:hypothetical protein [Stappia sp.]|uniref:hypothetical protein n=1 Tax=Stappia sp. TaxID=1870903 RepID=UPI003D0DD298
MTGSYLVFMTFMTLALLLMVAGYVRTLLFARRLRLLEDATFNPLDGVRLWLRIFTRDGFGPDQEPARRGIVRLYALALAAFAVAVLLFLALPVVPEV